MSHDSSSIASKASNYAHVLENAGGGYGDYVEQITYLLFLKLVPPWSRSTGLEQAGPEMPELGLDHS